MLSDARGDGFGEVAVGVVDDGEVCAVSDERAAHGEASQGCACGGSECVHGVSCGVDDFGVEDVFQLEEVVADGDAVRVGEFLLVGGDDDGCAWVGEEIPSGEDAGECGGFAVSGWHADDEVCVAFFQRWCDALEEIEDVWRGFEVGFDELRELQWRHR